MNLIPDQQIDRFIYFWGCWEPNESWLIRKFLRPSDVFVDVGANDGYYSLLASKLVGPSGQVVSIEPLPENVAELKANIALNGVTNISVIESAVSDTVEELLLTTPDGAGSGMATMRPVNGRGLRVKSHRLDYLLANFRAPRLVKIDVEGAEFKALKGLGRLLVPDRSPDILCEVTASYLREVGENPHALYSWMADLGYRAYFLRGHRLHATSELVPQRTEQEEVFFTKREVGEVG